ncbi:MAG: thiamine phosphate synthase [Pirellulaceae bacterium]|nr:thiamine phosphate synthase [Pirellulaceae bacterium]
MRKTAELLQDARLYVLLDGRDSPDSFAQLVQVLVEAGVDVLQLRDKRLPDRDLVERARVLRQLTSSSSTAFIVNDRPDIAVLSDADGVHVGQDELTVADCRALVGGTKLVGVSTHSLAQARRAAGDGADYIGCGPTFPSQTKAFEGFPGLEFLRAVQAEISLPAFAIGGINGENIARVLETGFRRIAVSGAVTAATDPAAAARSLCRAVRGPNLFTA